MRRNSSGNSLRSPWRRRLVFGSLFSVALTLAPFDFENPFSNAAAGSEAIEHTVPRRDVDFSNSLSVSCNISPNVQGKSSLFSLTNTTEQYRPLELAIGREGINSDSNKLMFIGCRQPGEREDGPLNEGYLMSSSDGGYDLFEFKTVARHSSEGNREDFIVINRVESISFMDIVAGVEREVPGGGNLRVSKPTDAPVGSPLLFQLSSPRSRAA